LLLLATLFFYRSQAVGLETSINLQLTVYPETFHLSGQGYIINHEINCLVLKWLDPSENSISSKFDYFGFSQNQATANTLNFKLILQLNQTEKTVFIPQIKEGTYNVSVHYYFGPVAKGNYNLTTTLFAEDSNETLDATSFW
jgi:hypothetical protein